MHHVDVNNLLNGNLRLTLFMALSVVTANCKMHFEYFYLFLFLLDHDRLECIVLNG